jgi:hypothetical protein
MRVSLQITLVWVSFVEYSRRYASGSCGGSSVCASVAEPISEAVSQRSQTEDEQRDHLSPRPSSPRPPLPRQSRMGRQRRRGPRTACACAPWRRMGTEICEKTIHSDLGQQFERALAAASNRGMLRLWDRAENSVPTFLSHICLLVRDERLRRTSLEQIRCTMLRRPLGSTPVL